MEDTKIEWADYTFNPVIGCTKVSPGCQHCYAETLMDTRLKQVNWGPGQPRKRTSESNWAKVRQWDKVAANEHFREIWRDGQLIARGDLNKLAPKGIIQEGDLLIPVRPRVFCASLADWLDPEIGTEVLADLLDLIRTTPHLDWLLLTKRPQLWSTRLAEVLADFLSSGRDNLWNWVDAWINDNPPANIWIGTTVEDQKRADERIPQLLRIPAKVRFLSCEPLLEEVKLLQIEDEAYCHRLLFPLAGEYTQDGINAPRTLPKGGIHWVIAGGESGPNARPMNLVWTRSLRDQCQQASVPFLFKQWGEWAPSHGEKTKGEFTFFKDGTCLERVGKKAAGRTLDGQIHHAFPSA